MAVLHFSVERRYKTTALRVSETQCPLFPPSHFLLPASVANVEVRWKLESGTQMLPLLPNSCGTVITYPTCI